MTTTNGSKTQPEEPVDPVIAGLTKMREPFPANQIGKLPQPVRKNDQDRGRCEPRTPQYSADGYFCGGWHARSIHLDYVGHAPTTDRLLDADLQRWKWGAPFRAVDKDVLIAACNSGNPEIVRMVIANSPPLIDADGGMYMELTVQGTTRLGYGDAGGKTGPNANKERIGDGLRNAGMRFGSALDLWHKGELHAQESPSSQSGEQPDPVEQPPSRDWGGEATAIADGGGTDQQKLAAILLLGKACTDAGELVGAVKVQLLARKRQFEQAVAKQDTTPATEPAGPAQ